MRHCIVTPDTLGPVKGGGIGTHCYYLSCLFARLGHEVTLLLTIPVADKEKQRWQDFYEARGVRLRYLQDCADLTYPVPLSADLQMSLRTWETLRHEHYDQIHFQDWRAHGFHCIQARRVQGAFRESLITVTAHSSTEWINQGMANWNVQLNDGAKLMWAERYCVEHCDRLLSPSHYMLGWLQGAGWKLPEDRVVIPNPIDQPDNAAPYAADVSSIAFFGRLETRKGLELFCGALKQLSPAAKKRIRRLLFVGVPGMCGATPGVQYIEKELHEFAGLIETHTGLDSFAAQELLRSRRCLICIPSLMDNLTYTGIECAIRGLPVLAAHAGGIPEVLPAQQLFEPTVSGFVAALEGVLAAGSFVASPPLYVWENVEAAWKAQAQAIPTPESPVSVLSSDAVPLVSICVAHFNHGRFLARALASLTAQEYTQFEVLVVDDGSSESSSLEAFASCRERFDARFRFFEKENEGPCLARNFCAQQARGDYLVFFDADNEALPHMLSSMVTAMSWSGADALSSHFWTFGENEDPLGKPMNRWTPLGAHLAMGLLENVFGDVNFIVRRGVFDSLGGFANTRHGCEDWEFLARLSLEGYTLDVIPDPLFWYRYTTGGMRSTMSLYHSHQLVFSTYKKHLPDFAAQAFEHLLIPISCGYSLSNAVIIRSMLRLGVFLEKKYTSMFPAGSLAQCFFSSLWHKCNSLFQRK